jgi:hypothetical protein
VTAVASASTTTRAVADCTPNKTYGAPTFIATGPDPSAVIAADLNGDGHLDLIVANSARSGAPTDSGSIAVLLGHGDGTFAAPVLYSAGIKPYDVKLADIDLDGHPDLVTANNGSNNFTILLGHGDGTFTRAGSYNMFSTGPTSLAIGDLTGDGLPEVIVACNANTRVIALRNLGGGVFGTPTANFSVSSKPQGVQVLDLNGDGHNDLLIAANGSNAVIKMLGNGDGTFQAQVPLTTAAGPVDVLVRDVDGDGRPDLVVPDRLDAVWPGRRELLRRRRLHDDRGALRGGRR